MGKKVVKISNEKGEGRAITGSKANRRRGKGHGTGKTNRQSSQDKPVRHRP